MASREQVGLMQKGKCWDYALTRPFSSNVSRERQIDWLTRASVCAKSVSSAAKQFEMLTLQKQLDTMLTELRGYS